MSEPDEGPWVTATGHVLTPAEIDALADEAERGYVLCSQVMEEYGHRARCGLIADHRGDWHSSGWRRRTPGGLSRWRWEWQEGDPEASAVIHEQYRLSQELPWQDSPLPVDPDDVR